MRKEEADPDTRLAGTQALYNALAFVKKNFDNETERNYIMQTVCETTQARALTPQPQPQPQPHPHPQPQPQCRKKTSVRKKR